MSYPPCKSPALFYQKLLSQLQLQDRMFAMDRTINTLVVGEWDDTKPPTTKTIGANNRCTIYHYFLIEIFISLALKIQKCCTIDALYSISGILCPITSISMVGKLKYNSTSYLAFCINGQLSQDSMCAWWKIMCTLLLLCIWDFLGTMFYEWH